MGAGRPKKPTTLKKRAGTLQPSRTNPNEPAPTGEPVPSQDLTQAALAIWDDTVPDLVMQGIVGKGDSHGLNVLCTLLAKFNQGDVAQEGAIRRWLNEYGLTPAARSKVSATKKPGQADGKPALKVG